jgi:hypothetical protein
MRKHACLDNAREMIIAHVKHYESGEKVIMGEIRKQSLELLASEEAENAGIRRSMGYRLRTIESSSDDGNPNKRLNSTNSRGNRR